MLNNFSILYSNGISIKSMLLLTLVIDLIPVLLLNPSLPTLKKNPTPRPLKWATGLLPSTYSENLCAAIWNVNDDGEPPEESENGTLTPQERQF